jgi:chemotaxis protein methyltransferase CheR
MTPDDFDFLSKTIKERSGIALTKDKEYLLETRLQPLARQMELTDLTAYVKFLKAHPHNRDAYRELIEAMTTNESMFFRDLVPFDLLRDKLLPALTENNTSNKKLRIWSAACSNGQEAYSVVMTLLENKHRFPGFDYEIVGTDIDQKVIKKAMEGIYTQFEVQRGMPIQLLLKYFTQADANRWQIKEELRKMVVYKYLNLIDSYMMMGKFDIIMCRNVLIYFEEALKRDILERMKQSLNPGGFLMLGSAETVIGVTDAFKPVENARGVFKAA